MNKLKQIIIVKKIEVECITLRFTSGVKKGFKESKRLVNQRTKIVLYNPLAAYYDMPLALLSVASVLDPEHYDVVIIDGRMERDAFGLLAQQLPDAICIGLSVITGFPIIDALKVSRKVKQLFPGLPVVWGGWHASLFPEKILEDEPCVDYTVRGQGVISFRDLVFHLEHRTIPHDVQGICYRGSDGGIITTPPRPLTPLDELPLLNYDLIQVERYFSKKGTRQLDFISSAGCLFRCAFCADPFVYGRKFTALSAHTLCDAIEALYQKYSFTDLNFQDETFFTQPERVRDFARGIIKRNIKISWAATMRADQGERLSEEIWRLCRESGLRRLLIGVESGSREMMERLNKDIRPEQVIACAERCRQFGISTQFPFIVGFPGEKESDIRASAAMMKTLSAMSPLFATQVFYFRPYPGSQITREAEATGYRLPATTEGWSEFDFMTGAGPWVTREKKKYFEALKFYLKLGYGRKRLLLLPFRRFAQGRCRTDNFTFPVEKAVMEGLQKFKWYVLSIFRT